MTHRIPPRSGTAFELKKGQLLSVVDPEGEQVCDMVAFSAADIREYLSSGRSIDYAGRIFLTTGDILYSNRSAPMLRIVEDDSSAVVATGVQWAVDQGRELLARGAPGLHFYTLNRSSATLAVHAALGL